jgi:hypothetical protein
MVNSCPDQSRLDRFLCEDFESDKERKLWKSHLETCDECMDFLCGHLALSQELGVLPIPNLSPAFDRKLREGLENQKARASSARLKRILLQGYWLLALTCSFLILDSLEVPAQLPVAVTFTLATSGVLAYLVLGYAMRHSQLGVGEFLVHTAVDPKL